MTALAPQDIGSQEEREQLLQPLLDDIDSLAAAGAAAIRDGLGAYTDQDHAFFDDVKDQITRNYTVCLQSLIEGRALTAEDLTFQRRASMRRARAGFALEDYLSGYRIGQQVLWDSIVAFAAESGAEPRLVLQLASQVMRLIDFATNHAGQAYVEFRQHGLADAARTRRDLLEHLLEGRMPNGGNLAVAAERLCFGPATRALVAVALQLGTESDGDWSEMAGTSLAHTPLSEPGMLVVLRQNEIVVVIPLVHGRSASDACRWLEQTQERLRAEGTPLAIGVSTVAEGVSELPAAFKEAESAVRLVGKDGGTAALTRLSAFEYMSLNADATARRLIDPRVRGFIDADRRRGGVLVATLRAYAETELSLKATAARLHVHPNTAQYRFQRIEELSGLNPRQFSGLHTLLVAVALTDSELSAIA